MSSSSKELHDRYRDNLVSGRELARKLAIEATRVAETLDRLAIYHEQLSESSTGSRSTQAALAATNERQLADHERGACLWFLAIADDARWDAAGTPEVDSPKVDSPKIDSPKFDSPGADPLETAASNQRLPSQ